MGLVGLGKVNGSQKTTPLEARLDLAVVLSMASMAFSLLTDRMELWLTPVECDLEISEAAVGVAVCRTGRPITGLEGTIGKVDDLCIKDFLPWPSSPLPQGRVLVLDSSGIVVTGGTNATSGLLVFS